MKIVYGLLSFLLVLKAVGNLYTFFMVLSENKALDGMTIFNAIFGFGVIIYIGYLVYKSFYKLPTTDEGLNK